MSSKLSSERGAILIHVAVASIVLIAFTMFVVDYGIMWVSRGQAQNAADSGALAGAVALGFDDFANRADDGPAKQAAQQFALLNKVFGEDPDVQVDTDVIFYDDDPTKFPDECADDTCIRVDVYRNQDRANPLPMIFGQLVGLVEQGVRATATARAAFGNASDCLKPWAVIDKWEEHWPTPVVAWNDASTFDKYTRVGNDWIEDPLITDPDVYTPPTATYEEGEITAYTPGTGFHPYDFDRNYTDDYGRQLVLKTGPSAGFEWGSGWFMALNLGDCGPGADCYRENIYGCAGVTYQIGDELEVNNEPGGMVGPTSQAVEGGGAVPDGFSLFEQDPDAYWDPMIGPLMPDGITHRGGIAGSVFTDPYSSPRVVAVPLVNPDLMAEFLRGGRTTVPISNIAGFFIERVDGPPNGGVVGRMVTIPGLIAAEGESVGPSSFLVNISLIR